MTFGLEHWSFDTQAAFFSGLTLGLASSAHCAAMCGPLILGVGRRPGTPSRAAQLRHALLYHAGRIAMYALLALPAGLLGATAVFSGFGRALAIGSGLVLLATAAGSIRARRGGLSSRYAGWLARLSTPIVRWSTAHPVAGLLATGALNGLLPCGLVYAALTAAGAAGSLAATMLLMAGFGAGTSLVLVAIAMGATSLPPSLRLRLRPVGPIVLAITAFILIARGVTMPHRHPVELSSPAAVHAHH